MLTAASARVGKLLRDGDDAPEDGNDGEGRLEPLATRGAVAVAVAVPQTVASLNSDDAAP
jgi:hypothetical protein